MKKYIVAVSGGIDSVVLLDMMAQQSNTLIVAHFDHGIRQESNADERFVAALAKKYQLPYETRREELGEHASESIARERRYIFLNEIAKKYNARIVTAHHMNDMVETVAINVSRGTGWRGLAVFSNRAVLRPLLGKTKKSLYEYALNHGLEWVEDETNSKGIYLRNRFRQQLDGNKTQLIERITQLVYAQHLLVNQIGKELHRFEHMRSRYFFIMMDEYVAQNIFHTIVEARLTRPQLARCIHAIKTAKAGTTMQAGGDIQLEFTISSFVVKTSGRVL